MFPAGVTRTQGFEPSPTASLSAQQEAELGAEEVRVASYLLSQTAVPDADLLYQSS